MISYGHLFCNEKKYFKRAMASLKRDNLVFYYLIAAEQKKKKEKKRKEEDHKELRFRS
jgi:hypothetical protein